MNHNVFKKHLFSLVAGLMILAAIFVGCGKTKVSSDVTTTMGSSEGTVTLTVSPTVIPTEEAIQPSVTDAADLATPTISQEPTVDAQAKKLADPSIIEGENAIGEYGEKSYAFVEYFQTALTKRYAGMDGESAAADYIKSALFNIGYADTAIEIQEFKISGTSRTSQNVVVTKPGMSDKVIVIGAHYDCASEHGVDDNASGVSALFESAMRVVSEDMPYTIVYVFFGAEEAGLYGSQYYVDSMTEEEKANTLLMINFDSILTGDYCYVYGGAAKSDGTVTDTWAVDQVYAMSQELGLEFRLNPDKNAEYPSPSTGDWSDHVAFKEAGITFIYFESTNWDIEPYDGYIQTELLGEVMHTENDNLDVIIENFGERPRERMEAFSQLLDYVLKNIEE